MDLPRFWSAGDLTSRNNSGLLVRRRLFKKSQSWRRSKTAKSTDYKTLVNRQMERSLSLNTFGLRPKERPVLHAIAVLPIRQARTSAVRRIEYIVPAAETRSSAEGSSLLVISSIVSFKSELARMMGIV